MSDGAFAFFAITLGTVSIALAALLVFRICYLLIPFFLSIFVVIIFERNRLEEVLHHHEDHAPPGRKQSSIPPEALP